MKIAHLADLHLGFRQYHRQTSAGINQREADVADAFRAAVDGVISARPDAVIIAGDLFHAVRPPNRSIVFAFRELQRLRDALPDSPVVLIAGNHDTPRSSDTGSILRLYQELGVTVVMDEAIRLKFPALDLSVYAVPHAAMYGPERLLLGTEGPERHQVLVIHGEVEGVFPGDRSSVEYGGALLDRGELGREAWSYVALGHYHVQYEVAPRIWYSGSLEYVSSNPWGELADEARLRVRGKGWLLADLAAGSVTRMPVTPARGVHDLPWLDATGMAPAAVDRAIDDRLKKVPGGLADAIVRLVVTKIPRHVVLELDHAAIRVAKAKALHFQLDLRRPESDPSAGAGAPGHRLTLAEQVKEYLSHRPLPARLSRERFVSLGLELLEEPDEGGRGGAP